MAIMLATRINTCSNEKILRFFMGWEDFFLLKTFWILPLTCTRLGDAYKYVWLASPERPDFSVKVRFGWLAPLKTEKKLKSRFISISPFMVIEIGVFWTWDISNVMSSPSLTWLAAWKRLKSGYHVSWRWLCFLSRFCYSRYLSLVVLFPEHFIFHATEQNLKIESTEFQHKPANKISQKDFHSIKVKTIF